MDQNLQSLIGLGRRMLQEERVEKASPLRLFVTPANQKICEDGKNIYYQKRYSAFISHNSSLTPMTHKIGCQD